MAKVPAHQEIPPQYHRYGDMQSVIHRRGGEDASAVRPAWPAGPPLTAPLHAPILSRPTDDVGRWGFSRRSIGPIVSVCDPSARPAWPSWLL